MTECFTLYIHSNNLVTFQEQANKNPEEGTTFCLMGTVGGAFKIGPVTIESGPAGIGG